MLGRSRAPQRRVARALGRLMFPTGLGRWTWSDMVDCRMVSRILFLLFLLMPQRGTPLSQLWKGQG